MIGGPTALPRFLLRRYIPLVDPDDPEARQPYHVVTEQDEERGMALVRQTLKTATTNAARATRDLIDRARGSGYEVGGAIVVLGSLTNPASIRQPHVRAHALEGRLYGDAVQRAVSLSRLAYRVVAERDTVAMAEKTLGHRTTELKATTDRFGRVAGSPWRLQEKVAALAGWMALGLR
jgi:hypothetical protein